MPEAVVIGAGPNGLVAANLLADDGWDVVVLEAEQEPGGAVRSGELRPGHTYDRFSAFYPLAAVSPPLRALRLEEYGLRWRRAPLVLASPFPDGRCAVMSIDPEQTATSVDAFAPGDGRRWLDMVRWWHQVGDDILDALLGRTFPPVAPAMRLLRRLGVRGALDLARDLILPVRRYTDERFAGEGAAMLLAANALHGDLAPEANLSGMFGLILAMVGQQHGFPVPEGGSGRLTDALVRRLEARGGRVWCGVVVRKIDVVGGMAVGVLTSDGRHIPATRAVLADVDARALYLTMLDPRTLPSRFLTNVRRSQLDNATVKVDWIVRDGIPWAVADARAAGTVHLARGIDHLTQWSAELAMGLIPSRPFLVVGQMTTADPTRSPPGTQMVWAYTHVPQHVRGDAVADLRGSWDEKETELFAERMEEEIEIYAPAFRDRVVERRVQSPGMLAASDANLVGGAINGGTAALHQQLIFRPVPGAGRPETPIRNLYLASASAHPGGGVHGACGANAARAALRHAAVKKAVVVGLGCAAAAALARRKG